MSVGLVIQGVSAAAAGVFLVSFCYVTQRSIAKSLKSLKSLKLIDTFLQRPALSDSHRAIFVNVMRGILLLMMGFGGILVLIGVVWVVAGLR